MKPFFMRKFIFMLCAAGMLETSTQAFASGFQLWEQDAASLGNYHAGYAAEANDASIAFYNPAGIPRIPNQQLVLGAIAITPDFKFHGRVIVIELGMPTVFNNVVGQGGTFNLVPNLHYVAPITDKVGFGFSVAVPFGLKTDWGRTTPLRYAATLSSITVIDFSPSLGFKITDQASLGFGFDVQKAEADFDSIGAVTSIPDTDTPSTNRATGTGYGYHLGALYEFSPCTRVGVSYHSQVVHHLSGTSKFVGILSNEIFQTQIVSNRATTRVTLPPYTALSIYHRPNPQWAVMGSVNYTQWNIFKTLTLSNMAGIAELPPPAELIGPSTSIQVSIPQNYRSTWNVSIGADYNVADKIMLRGGLGYDQSPARAAYRNVQLPDNDRFVIALGGHYQANKCLGFDLSWAHLFVNKVHVNPVPQVMGAQTVLTPGSVSGGADLLGAQITWNII